VILLNVLIVASLLEPMPRLLIVGQLEIMRSSFH